jgi:hypothetical protein
MIKMFTEEAEKWQGLGNLKLRENLMGLYSAGHFQWFSPFSFSSMIIDDISVAAFTMLDVLKVRYSEPNAPLTSSVLGVSPQHKPHNSPHSNIGHVHVIQARNRVPQELHIFSLASRINSISRKKMAVSM